MEINNKVVVRFAPSPTGFLHLGSARTCLFNWLYARRVKGVLRLRVEDTDKARSKKEFLDEILEDLKWLGIDWDGELVFQSERAGEYKKHAETLLEKGLAYKEGPAIIFKVPKDKDIRVNDVVHGEIKFNTNDIKDQVLIKSDGFPAYNFACVIDDNDMGITHIIRGDDHISNTPKQLLFYEALGFKVPIFAHMPLMMGKDGAKLSKRHGGTAVFEYKKEGFLPEALANYLLLLSWSPGENREIISLAEAKEIFTIEKLGNVQARFDIDKLKWINGEYIKNKNIKELVNLIRSRNKIPESVSSDYIEKVTELYKTRFRTFDEFFRLTECFFTDDFHIEEDAKKKGDKFLKDENIKKAFLEFIQELSGSGPFTHDAIEKTCRILSEKYNIKAANIIHPARVAISGKTVGAGLFEMMSLLGKEKVVDRMTKYCPVV